MPARAWTEVLGEAESFLLLEDLFTMTNRLAHFSDRAMEIILNEKRRPTSLAKLLFFRLYFKRFSSLAEEMISRPRKAIVREKKLVLSAKLSAVDASVLVNAIKAGYDGSSRTFPEKVIAPVRTATINTYEMRFLLWFVNLLFGYLNEVIPKWETKTRGNENTPLISSYELIRARHKLAWLRENLEDMGVEPLDYPENPPLSFTSHPVYSQLWRFYRRFESLIAPKGWNEVMNLQDWPTLYELWCFLSVLFHFEGHWSKHDQGAAKALAEELWIENTWDLWKIGTRPFAKLLENRNTPCAAGFALDEGITLYFQRRFPYYEGVEDGLGSLSTEYIPDICFISSKGNLPVLILDAKMQAYGGLIGKPETEEEIRGQIPGLRKMHIYRDAIVQYGDPAVWGAFALAPLAPRLSDKVKFRPFDPAWKMRHGFGAIEMRPSTKERALEEIRELVERWKSQV